MVRIYNVDIEVVKQVYAVRMQSNFRVKTKPVASQIFDDSSKYSTFVFIN